MAVKVLETFHVSPPPGSAPTPTTLPLTFFDVPWLFFSPCQFLFFYDFPHSTTHFTTTTLPNLKLSLSLTLQHFYPFAGNLSPPPEPAAGKPEIVYKTGDSVLLTVAECEADFNHLCGYGPRKANLFYPLVPELNSSSVPLPLMALRVTLFPNSGLCIGLSYHYVVADGRTCNHFMKTWASIFKAIVGGGEEQDVSIESLPFYDRTVIKDQDGLEAIFLEEWWKRRRFSQEMIVSCSRTNTNVLESHDDVVRATFVMGSNDLERIKQWIVYQCNFRNLSLPTHLSPSVIACAFVWVCLVKTQESRGKNGFGHEEGPNFFGYIAGGLTRLVYPVPVTYFGNCVGFFRSKANTEELVGEDGIIVASKVIGNTVKESDKALFGGAERWVSDWDVLVGSDIHVMVIGSPKLDIYETEFGWGRPKKIEEISIDSMKVISLSQSRSIFHGGIEVGLSLPNSEMDYFTTHFNEGLKGLVPLP